SKGPTDELTDPGMVDPSPSNLAVDTTKIIGFVPLVDALLLSNPKPILQQGGTISDEERLIWSEDEDYVMAVRDFKKFFKRIGRKCFKCGDPNHLIEECSKLSKDKNQRDFVRGSWSDRGEEDDEKTKDEDCLMAHASSEVHSESSYFSDENSSIDDIILDSEYNRLCKMSLKIITKNKHLKAIWNNLQNEIRELKEKLSKPERNKEVDLECTKCQILKIDNEKLKEEAFKPT
ncbi:zf-CCHC domain-containing protein, partial [Tanacetum coccineum]